MNAKTESQKGLEYFKKLQYDVVVKKRKDRFIVFVPELTIVEEDESLDKAYDKMNSEKEIYFEKMIENDYQNYIKEPEGSIRKKSFITGWLPFFRNIAIIIFIFLLLGLVGAKYMRSEYIGKKIAFVAYYMAKKQNIEKLKHFIDATKPLLKEFSTEGLKDRLIKVDRFDKRIAKLEKQLRKVSRSKNILKEGDHGYEVLKLQKILKYNGFYRGPVDGQFSPELTRAVKGFQKTKNLKSDGVVGLVTFKALGDEVNLD